MGKCTDETIGSMLHAWELKILPEEDKLKFEEHLISCSYCYELARSHEDSIGRMLHSDDLRSEVLEYADDKAADRDGSRSWFVRAVRHPVLRYALAAAVLLAVSLPLLDRQSTDHPDEQYVQTIRLVPTRSAGGNLGYLDESSSVRLSVVVPEIEKAGAYMVTVTPVGSEQPVYSEQLPFDTIGQAEVTLSLAGLAAGPYALDISQPDSDSPPLRTYYFALRESRR